MFILCMYCNTSKDVLIKEWQDGHIFHCVVCKHDRFQVGVGKWEPIETAPHNKYVLLRGDSGYVTTPFRVQVGKLEPEYRKWWITYSGDAFSDEGDSKEPHSWMHLPW